MRQIARDNLRVIIALVILVMLVVYPLVASGFLTFQIGAYALILGTIALSLMLLAGYGGMVSLAQLTVAGIAGYMVAILSSSDVVGISVGLPWWAVVPLVILIGATASVLIGLIAIRTEGIYTIMITLAIAISFFFLVRQNNELFNGFRGFSGISPPTFLGVDWGDPTPFYYLTLALAAFFYFAVVYLSRSPFGLALQAIRDNPRRMKALGFNVVRHRIGAYLISGVIASTAGILLVWFNGRISPGTVGVDVIIDILIIAIVGGLTRPIGPFLGAVLFVLLENYAVDIIDRERFNTVIGLTFLAIIFISEDGIIGLWYKLRAIASRLFKKPQPS